MENNLDSFAPPVDIQAELDAAPETPEAPADDVPRETSRETLRVAQRIDHAEDAPSDKPETGDAEDTVDPDKPKGGKMVPLGTLAEARRHTKELRAQMEERGRAHEVALAELNKKIEALANPPPPEPSFEENPAENLRQRQERLEREQQAWSQARQQQEERTQEETRQRQVLSFVNTEMAKAETEFTAKTPDYMEAVNYLRVVSEKNLRAQGVTDPAMIAKITYDQSLGMAANAINKGLNPAEVAYKFAQNYGYSPKVDATRQIKAMAEAQSMTQTMGNGKPDTPFSLSALAQMDDAEFDAAIQDNKTWSKIVRQAT